MAYNEKLLNTMSGKEIRETINENLDDIAIALTDTKTKTSTFTESTWSNSTDGYEITINFTYKTTRGHSVQLFKQNENSFEEVFADIKMTDASLTIYSDIKFDGKVVIV